MKFDPLDYDNKTNVHPVVDRSKQSTAEDWNDVKARFNAVANFFHIEAAKKPLSDGIVSFTEYFDDAFDSVDDYCVLKFEVYTIDTDGDGNQIRNIVAMKDYEELPNGIHWKPFYPSNGFFIDYFVMSKPAT